MQRIFVEGNRLAIPGLASAHSHAFQRALRGRTQRKPAGAASFWSWRSLMYELASKLDPEDVFHISRFAFAELAMSAVTALGEFHYLHHGPDGEPYQDRVAMADAVIQAAREAGLRICLIRSAYFRGGHGLPLEPAQRRFCDGAVEDVVADLETLSRRYAGDATVRIALAAHSLRAVPRAELRELAAYARRHRLSFHMHVAEQRREVEECLEEYGLRPVEFLAEEGILDPSFVAVHATHLTDTEIRRLGEAQTFVCLCRTTERDLGDGLPQTGPLARAGAKLCVGVDSHASGDAFEEIRAVELDERSRTQTRQVVTDAFDLLATVTRNGLQAIGFGGVDEKDVVYLDPQDPSLVAASPDQAADALVFSATPRAVREVVIAGRPVVKDGVHVRYEESLRSYLATLRKLELM